MNENNLEKILSEAQNINLSNEEKLSIKNVIISHVQNTPIVQKPVKSPFSSFNLLTFRALYTIPVALFVFVMAGAGTSYVAQSSLPGDALYPVKLNVNENFESLMAVSPEAKADIDLKQVSTRLDEAEALNVSGNLTEVKSQALQANFSKKVESLNKNIENVKKRGNSKKAEKVTESFEKEIDEHFNTFVTLSNSASNSPLFASIFKKREGKSGDVSVMMMTSAKMSAPASSSLKSEDKKGKIEKNDDRDDEDEEDDDDRDDSENRSIVAPTTPTSTSTQNTAGGVQLNSYTLVQVATHKTKLNCWTAVSGGVYDLTKWIAQHPGGEGAIIGMCGIDATNMFLAQHGGNRKAVDTLASYKIGILK